MVGGVAPHVTELAAALARRGHEVHLFARASGAGESYEIVHDVHIHRVPIELDEDFVSECNNMCNSFVWFIRESENFMQAHFDIIHAHDWLAAKTIVQEVVKKETKVDVDVGKDIKLQKIGRKTILTCHSTEFGRCGNTHFDGQAARIRAIEQEGCDHADRVIAVSGRLCDEVKSLYHCDNKLRMAYNGIQLHNFDGMIDCADVKGRYGIGAFQPTILFVGRLVVQKVKSLERDREFVVAVAVVWARELNVGHAVRFLGTMSGTPLKDLLKATDMVCVPSRNEPFGIVVLEFSLDQAWACGKPVVVTQSGGPGEFVRHGEDGYHVYNEPNSVAWGVKEVFSNFDRAREMGMRGRDRCEHEFSWDKIAETTENVYYEVA
ncbi:hypothetical protein GUITHDRAFT_103709 [Guillardia theta CCMP2712]|uniref:Glycosyltransferase subfamily 4-like N-terminal domain-containing protein n=1 Tax=Guillardia theta (strain CCMP2712) TaxID=905079 RepID=L1JQL1_GUITC|nr:hypothetical protein GUITHDRAFT_103709 [Guillardia theta CCMP2712]EKX50475.1 hypothetical protein GUITHDRAFT_103709 [Guillardia theta CCMP2712]|eukprot:XP_005837455.1 hypothetical protein GUITHDRAFT_103709 [Guillardia theta CCMP2712]